MKGVIRPRVAIFVVFVASLFMSIMDSTIVNVALSTMSRDFGVNIAATDVIVVAYLVSLAVIIPAAGWVGDRWGSKRTFLFALGVFSLASALCGLAQTLNQLVAARVVQGAGAGILTPVGTAMLYRAFLPHERIQVSRILIVPTVIAPASGPILGGFLVDHLSWHWVFFVNVPIGVVTLLFGLVFLEEHREPTTGRFDLAGFVLASMGFAMLMYALTQGSVYGWGSARILGSLATAVLALGVLVVVELRLPHPMIQFRLFENRLFRTANVVSLFGAAGFLGMLFSVPLFLQQGLGKSALDSGSATFPEALGVLVSSQIVARVYPRIGPRRLMGFGLIWVTAVSLACCILGPATNLWMVRLLMFCLGAGMASMFMPFGAAAFATISSADTGQASVISNAQNQLGGALGVAVASGVLAFTNASHAAQHEAAQPYLGGYYAAFVAAAVLALVGALAAWTIRDSDAAPSMRPASDPAAEGAVLLH